MTGDQVIKNELEISFLTDFLKRLSQKIINLIKDYQENIESIKNYEKQLIELLEMAHDFFSFEIYSEFFKKYNVFFTNELFELLLYTDNWSLITQILFCLRIENEYIPKQAIFNLSLRNRYILPYLERFFFFSNKKEYEKSFPFYKILMNVDGNFSLFDAEETFYAELKQQNDNEKIIIEIKHLNSIYKKEKPSFLILSEILKEKKCEDLLISDLETFINLLYTIKFLKINEEHQNRVNFLICQIILKSLREFGTYSYDSEKKTEIPNINNYICLFLLMQPTLILDVVLLKKLYQSYDLLEMGYSDETTVFKNEEEFYLNFSKKICEDSIKISQKYPDNSELRFLILKMFLKSTVYFYNKNEKRKFNQNIYSFTKTTFENFFLNNEMFQKDPISQLSNIPQANIFSTCLSLFDIMSSELEKNYSDFNEIRIRIIFQIIEKIFINENKDRLTQYPNFHIFESCLINLNLKYFEKNISTLVVANLSKILNTVKSSHHNELHIFFQFILSTCINDLTKITEEEKNCYFEIVEELFLKRNVGYNDNILGEKYKEWLTERLKIYNSHEELEKNFYDKERCINYFKIYLNQSVNLSLTPFSDIWNLNLLKSLLKPYFLEFMENFHEHFIKKDIIDLDKNLKRFLTTNSENKGLFKIYINYMILKYRNLAKGTIKLISNLKKVFNYFESDQDEFLVSSKCLLDIYGHPFMIGFSEKCINEVKSFFAFSGKEKNIISSRLHILNLILQNFDSFEKSLKRIIAICKEHHILLIDLLCFKKKLTCNYSGKKKKIEIANFLTTSLHVVHDVSIIEDLFNLSKMKTLFFFLKKCPNLEILDKSTQQQILTKFLEAAQKFESIIFEFISVFAKEYTKSQINEYNFYSKNYLFDSEKLKTENEFNEVYSIFLSLKSSNSHYKCYLKNYKLINRVLCFWLHFYEYKEDFINTEFFEKEKIDFFFKKSVKNIVSNFIENDNEILEKIEYIQYVVHNMILNGLINRFNSAYKLRLYATKKKLLDKCTKFQNTITKFHNYHKFNDEVCKKKPVSDVDHFLEILTYFITKTFSTFSTEQQIRNIVELMNYDYKFSILVDKFDKRLPFYRNLFLSIIEFQKCIKNLSFMQLLTNEIECWTFKEGYIGRKYKKNYVKLYSLFAELCIYYKINVKSYYSEDDNNLFQIMSYIFQTQMESEDNNNFRERDRKQMIIILSDQLQTILDEFSDQKVILKDCDEIAKSYDEFLNKQMSITIKFHIDLEKLSPTEKMKLILYFLNAIGCLSLYISIQPSKNEGLANLFSSFVFRKSFLNFLVSFIEKIPLNEDLICKKNIFLMIYSLMDNYGDGIIDHYVDCDRIDFYEKNMDIFTRLLKKYFSSENSDVEDTIPLHTLRIIMCILGSLDMNENKSVKLYNSCKNIILWIAKLSFFERKERFAQSLFLNYLILFENFIVHADEKQNLQKISLELKIKDLFYDRFLNTMKKQIKSEDVLTNETLVTEFSLNSKLFYEVFNNLCEFSEDKKSINLRKGVGI